MTIFFCPGCWLEVGRETKSCPRCHTDLEVFSAKASSVEKLMAALGHPEPQTAVRAAWLLGKLRAAEAVSGLVRIVQESTDPYLVEAAVEALGRIRDPSSRASLERARREGAVRVRRAAETALKRLEDGTQKETETGRV